MSDFVRARGNSSAVPIETVTAVSHAPRNGVDVAALAQAHLFGNLVSPQTDASNAPTTTLSLVLAGVLAIQDPNRGLAILGEAAKSAKLYVVGERVPGGALLHAVYNDRVVLDRNGSLESLLFPRFARAGGALFAANDSGAGISASSAGNRNPASASRQDQIPRVSGDIITTQAVKEGEQQVGFRIYPGPKRALFSMLGLAPGDLVTAIDGSPLTDESSGKAILSTLDSTSTAHFTVMRGGRQLNLLVDLTAIAPKAAAEPSVPAAVDADSSDQ